MTKISLSIAILCCISLTAQRKPKIKGNKNVINIQETLPAFNAIVLNDDLDIRLNKTEQDGYAITADDNLIDVLKFSVEDSILTISSFYNITRKKKLNITVNYVYLDQLTLLDGELEVDGTLLANELDLKLFNASKLQLTADALKLDVYMEGKSSADLSLKTSELNFILKDRVDARVYAVSDSTNLKTSHNASLKLEGTTKILNADVIENTTVKAERFEAQEVYLNTQNSSSAAVNALSLIELSMGGSSRTSLYGDAKIEIKDFLDTSQLAKKK